MPPTVFVYLGIMILTWAGNWPLMKLALGQVPPLIFVLLRLFGSLILIAPALVATRQPLLPVRGERLTLFWVGQLQVAGFLIFSIIGLAILPGGRLCSRIQCRSGRSPSGCFCGRSHSAAPNSLEQ
jgi:drug/metabolite transporter (DMT)-like permease